ncbi:copper homeostasis protein [Saonia flava]|uniref:PF03932 family protein CutC n=1 Tax=Saonia flava TaxID=523696 RepID=A0A846QUU0_9FLAO|nr:copper homeostasis protein CutC [Saonia flava]NJB70977.1 copper homeostasis protein [Saonia flava]
MLIEVCANSLESALNAQNGGADRIELCSELGIGGITPSYAVLKLTKEKLIIPSHVLIRPRSGDFTYSDLEFEIMKMNISLCKKLGFNGVVSGVLHQDNTLDYERTLILKELAGTMKFTFHRAFDWVKEPFRVLAQLEEIGVDYILTSGQKKSALEGINLLSELKQKASLCVILPGGGINETNAREFKKKGFKAIHLSGTSFVKTLEGKPVISMNSHSFINDDKIALTNEVTVAKICDLVK